MHLSNILNVVKCHTGGEVNNVVVGGLPPIPGATVLEKQQHFATEHDELRRRLLFEPRGSVTHCVNFVVPPTHPDADMGYIIAEATEYPAMSGSNTICTATVLLETGILPMQEPVTELTLEAPAGLIHLRCTTENGKVTRVEFTNQPAFVYDLDVAVDVPDVGTIHVDVAWGGMTYALVDAASLGLHLDPTEARHLCELGERIKTSAAEQIPVSHPEHHEFAGITQTQFTGPLERSPDGRLSASNAVIVSPGRIDRSACGTGTSARLAVLHARGEISIGEELVHRSIIGSEFVGRVEKTTSVGQHSAVTPVIAGQAWITELSNVGVDPTDPMPNGFTLGDLWGDMPT